MKRAYEGGTVSVHYERGQPTGSKIQTDLGTFVLPHWPSRIRDVRAEVGNLIVVETRSGEERRFGPSDALEEGGSQFLEVTTGSSMGGHSPKAHGKIRYIVRAFGKWAGGKQHICVKRLMAEHPEVVGGDIKRANALCAWAKDEWSGTTKWRGPGSNPKDKARDLGIEQKAQATAYARFTHSMPGMTNAELDAIVEAMSDLRPIEDMLSELGIDAGEQDPYVALFEYDSARSNAAIAEAETRLKGGEELAEAMQVWLAAHGDAKPIVEAELKPAVERIVAGEGSLAPQNDLDKRVIKAMQIGRALEPWDMQAPTQTPLLESDDKTEDRKSEVLIELPPTSGTDFRATMVVEGDYIPSGELGEPRAELMRMPFDDLSDRVRALYEATAGPTPEGRRYLSSCGRVELGRIVEHLEQAFAAEKKHTEESLEEAGDGNDLETDPQYRIAPNAPGWDSPERDKKVPTDLDEITLKHPPNLRRGYISSDRKRPRMCAGCLNFADGGCRAYDNYPVSAGELCDTFQSTHPLDEADGFMTRAGEDVGHYARIGRSKKVTLHLKSGEDGNYDEAVVRMGLSRLQNPENPTSEVHVGHVRVRHCDGEFQVEPDWTEHPDSSSNPERISYATVRHGARHATELANSRTRRIDQSGDAITKVDSGSPSTPANPQWPMMPQMGEANSDQIAEAIAASLSEKWVSWGKWKASHPSGGHTSSGHAAHIPHLLSVGTKGPYVRRVKNHLYRRTTGHFPHAASGSEYNHHFHQEVRAFQRAHGLQVDGIVGRQTIAAIRGNRKASKVAPGRLTTGDIHWLREDDDSPSSTDELPDRIVEELLGLV